MDIQDPLGGYSILKDGSSIQPKIDDNFELERSDMDIINDQIEHINIEEFHHQISHSENHIQPYSLPELPTIFNDFQPGSLQVDHSTEGSINFTIPKNKLLVYENLYSVILAIEDICDIMNISIAEDIESQEEFQKELDALLASYNILVCELDGDFDIDKFCAAVDIPCGYTKQKLTECHSFTITCGNSTINLAVKLGIEFTTLSNCIYLSSQANEYQKIIRHIYQLEKELGLLQRKELADITMKWLDYFDSLNPAASVPKNKENELNHDLLYWRYDAIG